MKLRPGHFQKVVTHFKGGSSGNSRQEEGWGAPRLVESLALTVPSPDELLRRQQPVAPQMRRTCHVLELASTTVTQRDGKLKGCVTGLATSQQLARNERYLAVERQSVLLFRFSVEQLHMTSSQLATAFHEAEDLRDELARSAYVWKM